HRLEPDGKGGLQPAPSAKLEEPLIVRPTSETIIGASFAQWVQSYRDLPLLINQWANVVRWEMRTRLFLRTMEFLWQEGHTAHATKEEAIEETERMLEVYATFAEQYMAMPVIRGIKTASERFAGAVETYCIEAMMQDGKALQSGTSHFLGQNFAKAFNCQFQNQNNELEYVWATSWGVSTRLIGALVMTHSDDQGLVLPPRLAPVQVVVVPIYRNDDERVTVLEACERIGAGLKAAGVRVKVDARESQRPGWKFNEYEVQGVPVRIAVGPRDVQNDACEVARRDTRTKESYPQAGLPERISALLDRIQSDLFNRARELRDRLTTRVDSYDDFKSVLDEKGGFVLAHWDGTAETEARIKEETKATIRCIPLNREPEPGVDLITGRPSEGRVLFARAY
ncbi:MAG TPA: proline--tRNA ligase, partial [Rhodothermales bacterium]